MALRAPIVVCVVPLPICGSFVAKTETTGSIVGTVIDDEGNPLSEALIVVRSPALQGERRVKAAEGGKFLVTLLPVGP